MVFLLTFLFFYFVLIPLVFFFLLFYFFFLIFYSPHDLVALEVMVSCAAIIRKFM